VVEGYSRLKVHVRKGNYIQSRSFRVGGYLWYLRCYPNGYWGYPDFISAQLVLFQCVVAPVKAQFWFSFINQADEQEPSRIPKSKVYDFYDTCGHFGPPMKRDAMESLKHLKGDSFTLRCDVVIVEDVKAKATSGSAASPFVIP
jgi:speckle-type POZ protein